MVAERLTAIVGLLAISLIWGLGGCQSPDPAPPLTRPPTSVPPPPNPPLPSVRPPDTQVIPAAASEPAPKIPRTTLPLVVPPGLPGAEATNPRLPADTPQTRGERLKAIAALYPDLPSLGPDPLVDGPPGARAVTLDDMLEIARKASPVLAQAAADVEIARGQWTQVGLYPNPTSGFRGDQILDGGPFGQFGGYFNQPIVINGRLKLARMVAAFDLANAQLRLKKANIELTRQVRTDFYAALVAAESVRVNRLIAEFTSEVFRRQVDLVRAGAASAYEASAFRAVQGQARVNLIQARNRYIAARQQLAATINTPNLTQVPLAGKVDEAFPRYRFEVLRERLLTTHTDISSAQNSIAQAEKSLTQERRKPLSDVQNEWYFQDDTLLRNFQFGATLGLQVPIFDRNQGGIMAARARLTKSTREVERVRNDLLRQLADAHERYETGRQQLELYRVQILPDLVRAFKGAYDRYQVEPDKVGFTEIGAAERNLDTQIANYLQALQQQWTAAADLTAIVQAEGPYDLAEQSEVEEADRLPPPSILPSVLPPSQ